MLPLSDRVLMKLRASTLTARQVAVDLEADIPTVGRILRGLEAQGVVEQATPRGRTGAAWRLAPGVRIAYVPASVSIQGAHPPRPMPTAAHPCRAITATGDPCRLGAMRDGLCFLHAPPSLG
jgi:hypothetical protein